MARRVLGYFFSTLLGFFRAIFVLPLRAILPFDDHAP